MADSTTKSTSSKSSKPKHLCVLVHGLWGNANHLSFIADSLRARYADEELIVYSATSNTGTLTYDGIDIGAQRVAREIEDILEEHARDGDSIKKFSIVGYSLGGLVSRFVVGLLDHQGYFERIAPVNFVTFASPHLGVRAPLLGYHSQLWNVLGASTLSTSGRQLFLVDDFRQTGRPLLSILADPDSIFIRALAKFQKRCLYANIVNDRSAVFYTTAISKYDPYVDLDKLRLRYVKNYDPVILDLDCPFEKVPQDELPTFYDSIRTKSQALLKRLPFYAALSMFLPIFTVGFLINSVIQTVLSNRRIQLHEKDDNGLSAMYRIPFFAQKMRAGLEGAFENVNSAQEPEYLPEGSEAVTDVPSSPLISVPTTKDPSSKEKANGAIVITTAKATTATTATTTADFPTLALTPAQFAMIKALDDVGFKKFGVHIHNSHHSHAAIIVRMPRKAFTEGKLVMKHWLENEFIV